jgi:hypothetical protein
MENDVEHSQDIKRLREKAAKYRAIARAMTDDDRAADIFKLTAELEQQVRDMERARTEPYRSGPISPMVGDGA